jgi:hypothetical protein
VFAGGDADHGVPGFGPGLAIVQRIVTRLQGQSLFEGRLIGTALRSKRRWTADGRRTHRMPAR